VSLSTSAPAKQNPFENERQKLQGNSSLLIEKSLESHLTQGYKPADLNGRLNSLDAFRGFTVASMILVNSPGDTGAVYSPLVHADWNGWTFADTVFPFFLFIVGVSLAFSFAKQERKGTSNLALIMRILRRTVILFAIGVVLNAFEKFGSGLSDFRIPGVLQRIAICYCFASLIVLTAGLRGRIMWLIGLLASYWAMMLYIPVPGIGTGVLEPGRNFAAWVDSHVLNGHMWWYYDGQWDPEGIVSTIPAIATTLFGLLTGKWLKTPVSDRTKVVGIALAGMILVAVGQILSRWMPINKNLWTSTFSIFMAGLALLCLGFFYWLIEIADFSRWTKAFIILGVNPISMYVLSEVFDPIVWILNLSKSPGQEVHCQSHLFGYLHCVPPEMAALLHPIVLILFIQLIAWVMWRKQIFIRI
jgi:predicted acyltransferase